MRLHQQESSELRPFICSKVMPTNKAFYGLMHYYANDLSFFDG